MFGNILSTLFDTISGADESKGPEGVDTVRLMKEVSQQLAGKAATVGMDRPAGPGPVKTAAQPTLSRTILDAVSEAAAGKEYRVATSDNVDQPLWQFFKKG